MWHLFATPKKMLYDYTTLFLKWSDIGNLISTRVEDVRVSKMCLLGTGHASQNPCKSMDAPNDHERTCLTDGSGACYVVLSLMLSQLYIVIWIYNKLYTDHCYCYFILMNITTITCYYYLFVYYNVVKKLYIYIYTYWITLLFLLLLCYILLNPHCTIGGLPLDVHDVLSTSSTVLQQASHCQRQGAEASVGCWMITCGT